MNFFKKLVSKDLGRETGNLTSDSIDRTDASENQSTTELLLNDPEVDQRLAALEVALAEAHDREASLELDLEAVNRELAEAEQRHHQVADDLANLVNSTEAPIIFVDRTLTITRFTPVCRSLFDLQPYQVGLSVAGVSALRNDRNLIDDAINVVTGEPRSEAEIECENGAWYLRRITPYQDGNGQVVGAVISFHDVTRPKQESLRAEGEASERDRINKELQKLNDEMELRVAERTRELEQEIAERAKVQQALADNEERLKAVISTAVDAIITITDRGIIQSFNPAAENMFGYKVSEVLGHNIAMLMPEDDADRHDAYIARYHRSGAAKVIGLGRQVNAMKRDGTVFPAHLSVSKMEIGGKRAYTGILRDNTFENELNHNIKTALVETESDLFIHLVKACSYREVASGHALKRMARIAGILALQAGLDKQRVMAIEQSTPLHDIGWLGVPDRVLMKPGKLTPDERLIVQDHVRIGADILAGNATPLFATARKIVLNHHEWWNGKGYPYGRAGRDIAIEGRIVAIADVFDALISDRPYKAAWDVDIAFQHIRDLSGQQFDPDLVQAFFSCEEQIRAIVAGHEV